jgi:hypothetical protein
VRKEWKFIPRVARPVPPEVVPIIPEEGYLFPDYKPLGESRYIGLTPEGLPIPKRKPSPPHTKKPWPGRINQYRAKYDAKTRRRRAQRMASRRPDWWSPNGVIERLENGERICQIVEQAEKDSGRRVKLRVLFRDLSRWKKMVKGFKEDYRRAQHLYQGNQLPKSRWGLFFKTMEAFDGKVEVACAALGIGAKVIYGMLDPQFKTTYSKDFAELFRRAELDRMAPIRSQLLNKAERPDADPKVQLAVLEAAMPALHGKKKTIDVKGGIALRLERAAEEQRAASIRALSSGREQKALPAAPEPVTVEIVAEAVKEAASADV